MTAADENMSVDVRGRAESDEEEKLQILKGAAFLSTAAAVGMIGGFGSTLAMVRKKSPEWFSKGVAVSAAAPESGTALALRALAWGSLGAVTGVGLLGAAAAAALGVHSLSEFRQKMQSFFPSIPKPSNAATGSESVDWDSVFGTK